MSGAKVIANDPAHSNYWRERNLREGTGQRVAGIVEQFDTVFRQVSRVVTFFGTLLVLHYITSDVLVDPASLCSNRLAAVCL
jgi:hypothetical protein